MNIKKCNIGNILASLDKEKLVKILGINSNGDCKCKILKNSSKEFNTNIERLVPLPITEKLLKKLEFLRKNDIITKEKNIIKYSKYYGQYLVLLENTDLESWNII